MLVDLQQNGALGRYYNELHDVSVEHLENVAGLLRRHGVGRCLITLTTYPEEPLLQSAAQLGQWLDERPDLASLFTGVFHEGIFVSPEDGWRGAHNRDWLRTPDYDCVRQIDEAIGRQVRMVNVPPEQPGGLEFLAAAVADGKIAAIGHASPEAKTIRAAIERGASVVSW
ncbi:MAG: hypothetical protein ACLFWL_09220 [Candidatus Brocadiia bacterium]